MQSNTRQSTSDSPGKRWLRFFAGLTVLTLFASFFASGYTPPGVFGEVLRHNRENNIDASPLLYSEVEHMARLEQGVRELRYEACVRRGDCTRPKETP